MIVQCPNCGKSVVVNGFGRKPLNIPLKNVCDSLQAHRNVVTAANALGCSAAYIFGVLKANGIKLKEVINGKGVATKDTAMFHNGERTFFGNDIQGNRWKSWVRRTNKKEDGAANSIMM